MHWEFWITIIIIASAIGLYPFFRWLIKRTFLLLKILVLCKRNKYKLHKNYFFWFFRDKHSKKCDFYIETKNDIYAIKLFGIKKRSSILVLLEDYQYYIKNYYILFGRSFFTFTWDSKVKDLPQFDFKYKYKGIWYLKKHHNILLINPSCFDIQSTEKSNFYSGDDIAGMEIHSLSGLIKSIKLSSI